MLEVLDEQCDAQRKTEKEGKKVAEKNVSSAHPNCFCEQTMQGAATPPDLSHLTTADFEDVYEPSDDTYLFLDALLSEEQFILQHVQPRVCIEIG